MIDRGENLRTATAALAGLALTGIIAASALPAAAEAGAVDFEKRHRSVSCMSEAFGVPLALALGDTTRGRLIRDGVGIPRVPPPVPDGSMVVRRIG